MLWFYVLRITVGPQESLPRMEKNEYVNKFWAKCVLANIGYTMLVGSQLESQSRCNLPSSYLDVINAGYTIIVNAMKVFWFLSQSDGGHAIHLGFLLLRSDSRVQWLPILCVNEKLISRSKKEMENFIWAKFEGYSPGRASQKALRTVPPIRSQGTVT